MCGIAGIFNRNKKAVDIPSLVRMTRTLIHRGPDQEGFFINGGPIPGAEDIPVRHLQRPGNSSAHVGLGHRRLSIIDLHSGRQPLSNEDGNVWISFNGEIYNYTELLAELEKRGHRFRTRSDTEAIVHAYEEWGVECLHRLRGMFAFAIWDEIKQQLLVGRDRLGKKPLYFAVDQARFLFASEIKALLQCRDLSRELDYEALSDYLSLLYVPAPKSIFSSVRKLPAGHYAVVTADDFEIRQYWDLCFHRDRQDPPKRIQENLLEILDEATRLRMVSDVPVGAFLSGGVDSSAVVAFMSKASADPVKTNAISFSDARYDESAYAREVATRFGADHCEFRVDADAVAVIEKLAWHYDEPFADSSAAPTYYVSKMTRDRVTVALSGDGGDENFAGYRRYYFDNLEHKIRILFPGAVRRPLFGAMGYLYPKADYLPQVLRGKTFLSNIGRDPAESYCFSVSAFKEEAKRKLLRPEISAALQGYRTDSIFRELYNHAPADDHLSRIQYIDIKTYLAEEILTKVDRASMAVSLEVRCPILDHKFVEYAATIPPQMKLVGRDGKHIFKQALTGVLPPDVLWRRKTGFSIPVGEWFRGSLRGYLHEKAIEGPATAKYLQRPYVEKMYRQHMNGIRDWTAELWTVLMLNQWEASFVSGGPS